jgi:uncharacterized protein (DUF2267 family)
MDDHEFLRIVQQTARISHEEAERATRATLQTLADRITAGEARDLAEQLPPRIAAWVATTSAAQRFDLDEFLRRVAEREGVDPERAERDAAAVFAALGRAVSPQELADVAAELPKDFARLLPRGPHVDVLPAETFVRRVAERAGLDDDRARAATAVVLETLAERIAGGEVDDLVSRLPVELHEPLKRGRARTGDPATRMSLDKFLARVAEREGTNTFEAREHTRAVLATLREAVGDDEFFDVSAELPGDYAPVLARR